MHPKHPDLRDRYPKVERPHRADGSPEAVERCLEPVSENLREIGTVVYFILGFKGLLPKEVYLFQSRAMGTCKPGSDIDIYVQLENAGKLVSDHGVLYKDTGAKVICGEWAAKYLSDLPPRILKKLKDLNLDIFFGVDPEPPAKAEYKDRRYFIPLEELAKK